jgi:hypothetical protein
VKRTETGVHGELVTFSAKNEGVEEGIIHAFIPEAQEVPDETCEPQRLQETGREVPRPRHKAGKRTPE